MFITLKCYNSLFSEPHFPHENLSLVLLDLTEPENLFFQLLNSSDTVVVLKTVDLEASGIYRCEVSGEESMHTDYTYKMKVSVINGNLKLLM